MIADNIKKELLQFDFHGHTTSSDLQINSKTTPSLKISYFEVFKPYTAGINEKIIFFRKMVVLCLLSF